MEREGTLGMRLEYHPYPVRRHHFQFQTIKYFTTYLANIRGALRQYFISFQGKEGGSPWNELGISPLPFKAPPLLVPQYFGTSQLT